MKNSSWIYIIYTYSIYYFEKTHKTRRKYTSFEVLFSGRLAKMISLIFRIDWHEIFVWNYIWHLFTWKICIDKVGKNASEMKYRKFITINIIYYDYYMTNSPCQFSAEDSLEQKSVIWTLIRTWRKDESITLFIS